jgi:hypothetical protein
LLLTLLSLFSSSPQNYLRLIVAIQYIPRIIQVLPVQAAVIRPEGVVFETAWSGFVINLAMFLLAAHVRRATRVEILYQVTLSDLLVFCWPLM